MYVRFCGDGRMFDTKRSTIRIFRIVEERRGEVWERKERKLQ